MLGSCPAITEVETQAWNPCQRRDRTGTYITRITTSSTHSDTSYIELILAKTSMLPHFAARAVILPETGKNFFIRACSRLFQNFGQSSCKHKNNYSALLAFHSNVLVTSNILNFTARSFFWQKFRKHQHTSLHICSGLETHFTNKKKLDKEHWKAAEKWDQNGMDLTSLLKNHWLHFLLLLHVGSACKSKLPACLLPQSGEHIASGWHLTVFSCSKKGRSQGQPIQPGCSAKVAVPSWGNSPLNFS